MKRWLSLGVLCLLSSARLFAGEPTTVWPYLFDDFLPCKIYFHSGETGSSQVNVHLLRNDLHYLHTDGKIYQADYQHEIARVVLADSTRLVRCENYFIEVLGETPQALVGRRTTGDFDRLNQGSGGYGTSSSTSATDRMASLPFMNTPQYHQIKTDRENGQTLPVSVRYCFVVNGELVYANKKEVSRLLPDAERKNFAAFLKTNKIKWKNHDDLRKVLEYISPYLAK